MNYQYKKNNIINYTDVNPKLELSLIGTASILQNTITEFYSSFEQGNYTTKSKYNAVWVYTKIKIQFNKRPKLNENIITEARTVKVTPIRTETETVFINENQEEVIVSKHEACVMDVNTRKIRKLSTVNYPENMQVEKTENNIEYTKLNEDFLEADKVYAQKVCTADIDYSKHTNNVMYIKYIVNALPVDFWEKHTLKEFEIHYIRETVEGENLEIYKKQNNDHLYFLIKSGEKEVARAFLCVEN